MKKKLLCGILAIALIACLLPAAVMAAEGEITITLAIEKFTLGQGYILEPTLVTVEKGTTVSQMMLDFFQKEDLTYNYIDDPADLTAVTYISSIRDEDQGLESLNIPEAILTALDISSVEELDARKSESYLGEMDYSEDSGWMYSVNDYFPVVGVSQYTLMAGDVVRFQYTLYGLGADVDSAISQWGQEPLRAFPHRDGLTHCIAVLRSQYTQAQLEKNAAYAAALEALADWEVTDSTLNSCQSALVAQYPNDLGKGELPSFTKNLSTEAIVCRPNEEVTLSVEMAESAGALSYQWCRTDNGQVEYAREIPGATGASYTVPTAERGTCWYYVRVTNQDQSLRSLTVSAMACITVEVGTQELTDLVAQAEALEPNAYVESGWTSFEAVLTAAKAVSENVNATAEEIVTAYDRLTQAMAQLPMLGDANEDGKVTTRDVTLALKSITGSAALSEGGLLRGDVTGDGKVTTRDVTRLLKYITGSLETLR